MDKVAKGRPRTGQLAALYLVNEKNKKQKTRKRKGRDEIIEGQIANVSRWVLTRPIPFSNGFGDFLKNPNKLKTLLLFSDATCNWPATSFQQQKNNLDVIVVIGEVSASRNCRT